MDSKFFSIINRASSTSSMQQSHNFSEILAENAILRRSYYTSRNRKAGLYSKISPLGSPNISVLPELESWVEKGNKVRVAELQRIIHDFRKRKRFSQALEVSEWIHKKGICSFSPTEYAVQLDLIGRVRGFLSAENYFNNLKDLDKTDKTYGALLNCYVRQRQIDKSLAHLEKMKKLGFASSPLTYNDIMCLYTNVGQVEKVPYVLNEMKINKVSPDNFSYRICINSYGARSDIGGMENILKEMETQPQIAMDWNTYAVVANFYTKAGLIGKAVDALKKAEVRLDKKDGLGFNHLISLYATLGNTTEVLRLWSLEKNSCNRHINRDYITMMQSLVKLGEFEEAEKLLKEWDLSGNCYDFRVPNIIVIGYTGKGLFEKAETLLEDLMEKGKASTPNSWGMVGKGYFDKGNMEKALKCLKVALSIHVENKEWKPNSTVVEGLLSWIGDKGRVEDADSFLCSLRNVIPINKQM